MRAAGHAAGVRFYLDENLSQQIAVIARSLGVDVTSAQELGRLGIDDEDQLAFAASEHRCIVTQDYSDFPGIAKAAAARAMRHSGVLMVTRSLVARGNAAIADALRRFDREHPNEFGSYGADWLT